MYVFIFNFFSSPEPELKARCRRVKQPHRWLMAENSNRITLQLRVTYNIAIQLSYNYTIRSSVHHRSRTWHGPRKVMSSAAGRDLFLIYASKISVPLKPTRRCCSATAIIDVHHCHRGLTISGDGVNSRRPHYNIMMSSKNRL